MICKTLVILEVCNAEHCQKAREIGEDKYTILWNQRKEKLERILQNFCYAPAVFTLVLYSLLYKDKIRFLEFISAAIFPC